MSLVLERSAHANFEKRLRTITAAGVKMPDNIVALRERLDGFRATMGANACRERLAKAVIDGDKTADTALLWAAALAEATMDDAVRQNTEGAITAAVNAEIRARYVEHARGAWAELAAVFNSNAAAFTKAATTVDVEQPADLIVGQPKPIQDSWTNAKTHALRMTSLLPALSAAASLAGVCNDKGDRGATHLTAEVTVGPDVGLALTVETTRHDREQLWAAWDIEETERIATTRSNGADGFSRPHIEPSRCGRWGALHRLGATIHAIDNLDDYHDYSRYEPVPVSNDDDPALQVG